MDYALDEEHCPSPEGRLFDNVNSEEFAKQFMDMEDGELSNLDANTDISLSDICPDVLSLRTPREDKDLGFRNVPMGRVTEHPVV